MKRLLSLIFSAALSSFGSAQASDCDAVLIPQISTVESDSKYDLNWLNIINQSSYDTAKSSAGASYYGDLFKADYNSFKINRSSLFKQKNFNSSESASLETFKQSLSEAQISGWVKCKVQANEIAIRYKNVSPNSATIVITWKPADALGKLDNLSLTVTGGKVLGLATGNSSDLLGEQTFIVSRDVPDGEVHGIFSGRATSIGQNYTADFYIPKPAPVALVIDTPPPRLVVSNADRILTTIATWGGGQEEMQCLDTPAGFDRVDVETIFSGGPERMRRGCWQKSAQASRICDSAGERCNLIIIKNGCFVSKQWHDYYKKEMKRLNMPYTPAAVCAPEV